MRPCLKLYVLFLDTQTHHWLRHCVLLYSLHLAACTLQFKVWTWHPFIWQATFFWCCALNTWRGKYKFNKATYLKSYDKRHFNKSQLIWLVLLEEDKKAKQDNQCRPYKYENSIEIGKRGGQIVKFDSKLKQFSVLIWWASRLDTSCAFPSWLNRLFDALHSAILKTQQ